MTIRDIDTVDARHPRRALADATTDEETDALVRRICSEIRTHGDDALLRYARRYDRFDGTWLRVPSTTISAARRLLTPGLHAAMEEARRNIALVHGAGGPPRPTVEVRPGVEVRLVRHPLACVGLYAPAGSAPLPSTVLMLGVPARLAGCRRVVLCSPPTADGGVDPVVLAAAAIAGIDEVYAVGGAQAIAAMAYGTDSVPRVDKIFGPGNRYVAAAKRFVAADPGGCAIDMVAGPTELLVLADDSAPPELVAADLLSQAEHDPDALVTLVTPDRAFGEACRDELARQLSLLPRRSIAAPAVERARAIVTRDLDEAVALVNAFAPEHLAIICRGEDEVAMRVTTAGAVFVGRWTPVAAGDYATGANHTLPTSGTARAVSGVTLDSFSRTTTLQRLTREGLASLAPTIVELARAEGLEGHARAVTLRDVQPTAEVMR